jgi:hypothetical protein
VVMIGPPIALPVAPLPQRQPSGKKAQPQAQQEAQQQQPAAPRRKFSEVLHTETIYSKCTRALTCENTCGQPKWRRGDAWGRPRCAFSSRQACEARQGAGSRRAGGWAWGSFRRQLR